LKAQSDELVIEQSETRAEEASHLIRLPGERWALWTWVCTRGAGFPAADALKLGDPECALAAGRVLAAEEEAERQRELAVEAVRRSLLTCEDGQRNRRVKLIGRLRKGLPPPAGDPDVAGLAAALEEITTAREHYQEAFKAALARQSAALREIAADPLLREAVTWQNRHALESGFDPLLRAEEGRRGSHERRNEQLVASYLYRYSLKNDTIGFFGPVGWARVTDGDRMIAARPGAGLVSNRNVFFETWCIDAVAEALTRDKPLRPWLTPRKLPLFALQGNLYIPFGGKPFTLSPAELAAFEASTGRETALELADRLMADPALGLGSREEVLALFESLAARRMIAWEVEVPMALKSEEVLAGILSRVEDEALREPMLQGLSEIVERKAAVAAAAGDAVRLAEAMTALEDRFEELTGRDSQRLQGMAYAGRSLVHEDCRRDLEVELGQGFLEALGPPLSLLLLSARWMGEEIGRRYREEFARAYAEVCARTGSRTVSLLEFMHQIGPVLLEPRSSLVTAVADEHRRRWAGILDLPDGERRVQLSSDRLRPLVAEAFPASGPGWRRARQHSPDLMVRAESLEAIRRGEFELVLGELHFATNTLNTASFMSQHPNPEEPRLAMLRDIPGPTLVPWMPKKREGEGDKGPLGFEVPPTGARLDFGFLSLKDLRLLLHNDPPSNLDATTLFPGDLVVTERDGELSVVTRDGRHCLDAVNFFEIAFSAQSVNSYRLLPSRRHTPRIAIDRMIVQREMWRTPLREVPLIGAKTEEERFLAAQRYRQRYGMPRFVFVRSIYETKPFFVDFASPVAIEILARICRRALEKGGEEVQIGVSEMLPEPDQCWLPGAQGERYTSELRFVAVDRSGLEADEERKEPRS
jgi:hypothetical protein